LTRRKLVIAYPPKPNNITIIFAIALPVTGFIGAALILSECSSLLKAFCEAPRWRKDKCSGIPF
jgi:hypothetical protein